MPNDKQVNGNSITEINPTAVEIQGKKINQLPVAVAITPNHLFVVADSLTGIAYQATEPVLMAATSLVSWGLSGNLPAAGSFIGTKNNVPLVIKTNNIQCAVFDIDGSLTLSPTWNTSASPTGIKLNVTNTQSGAAALLMDLQVDGVSLLKVDKKGNVGIGSLPTDFLDIRNTNGTGISIWGMNPSIRFFTQTTGNISASIYTNGISDDLTRGLLFRAVDVTGTNGQGDNWHVMRFGGSLNKIFFGGNIYTSAIFSGVGLAFDAGSGNPVIGAIPAMSIQRMESSINKTVIIGDNVIQTSAILNVVSLNTGVLLPRMTTAQSIGIPSPATGLLLFDTNLATLKQYTGATNGWGTFIYANAAGNVGIGTVAPATMAILDITSTTKGVLIPRMTTAQKNAIATPSNGLLVYDQTLNKLCIYEGAIWKQVTTT